MSDREKIITILPQDLLARETVLRAHTHNQSQHYFHTYRQLAEVTSVLDNTHPKDPQYAQILDLCCKLQEKLDRLDESLNNSYPQLRESRFRN